MKAKGKKPLNTFSQETDTEGVEELEDEGKLEKAWGSESWRTNLRPITTLSNDLEITT